MGLLALLGEGIPLFIQATKLGLDVAETAQRAVALAHKPTPATPEELADFKALLDAEKARLDELTAELNQDPPKS